MPHYNFPPFCVGETGRVGTPKRREIGHGVWQKEVTRQLCRYEHLPICHSCGIEITESNGRSY